MTGAMDRDMLVAKWSGNKVQVYDHTGTHIRDFSVPNAVVGVQISGDGMDAMVAIAQDNGKTWIYQANGTTIRRM